MRQRPLVLLIDDDPAWLDLMALHLQRRGFDSVRAETLTKAAAQIGAAPKSLRAVVCKLDMPKGGGQGFRKRMRKTAAGRKLPFLFLCNELPEGSETSRPAPRPTLTKSTAIGAIVYQVLVICGEDQRHSNRKASSTFSAKLTELRWQLGRQANPLAKRGLDLILSGLALLILAPLGLLFALAIRGNSRGSVLYSQDRVGRDGRIFRILKFRSMHLDAEQRLAALASQNDHADATTFKMKHDPRITAVGRWLRRSSLDELPQLWNVFVGDMALVGPRPPTPVEVNRYGFEAWKRLGVTPGLTGLWQVSGRSELAFPQQLELDCRYIQRGSFWNDIKILAATIPAVISGRGAY